MPRAAARLGAVTELLPLDKIAAGIQRAVRETST
jgi:chemotaxis response regulator CheB